MTPARSKPVAPRADDKRRRELAAIHTGKRELGLDEETYHALLIQVSTDTTGVAKTSSAEFTAPERAALLDAMRRAGFRANISTDASAIHDARNALRRDKVNPQIAMITGLWHELGAAGAVRTPTTAALRQFAKRVAGVSTLEWASSEQASRVIEALKAMRDRHERREGGPP